MSFRSRSKTLTCGIGVVVVAVGFSTASQLPALATDPDQGPLNVSLTGESASGINESAFVAVAVDDVNPGATFTATATSPAGTVTVPVYAIPVDGGNNPITGADNATVWVPLPSGATTVQLTWSSGTPTTETYPVGAPNNGASISVTQDADGSRNITATAIVPKFSGNNNAAQTVTITDAFFLNPNGFTNYAFHVFDADTGEWLNPGRSGVQKSLVSVGGTDMLQMVDPLVLPESALGRNIRVGFVTYYYTDNWSASDRTSPIPIRYGGLSAAILMRLGGSASSSRALAALQQFSVPAGTQVDQCGALAPEHVDAPALVKMRDEGWSIGYAQWPNQGQGGWVCSRQPMLTALGWVVQ